MAGPGEPLLEAAAKRGFLRTAASWHGPNPVLTLLVLLSVAGFACLASDKQADERGLHIAGAPFVAAEQVGMVPPLAADAPSRLRPEVAVGAAFAVLVALLVGQVLCDGLVREVLGQVLRSCVSRQLGEGAVLSLGSCRVTVHLGRFSLRHSSIEDVIASGGRLPEKLLVVKHLEGTVAMGRFLRSCGRELEMELRLEGVDVLGGAEGGRVVDALRREEVCTAPSECKVLLRSVSISGITVFQAGVAPRSLKDVKLVDAKPSPKAPNEVLSSVMQRLALAL